MTANQMQQETQPSKRSALVLGATGGFGKELCRCLAARGWQVKALTRNQDQSKLPRTANSSEMFDWVYGDLDKPQTLDALADNVDVIVHAANVPYPKWDPLMYQYTRSIIKLAQNANAHLLFVGNIYNAGIPDGGVINEHTQDSPIAGKGRIRADLEQLILNATEQGLRATVMRFGDFFGPETPKTNWFYMCTKDMHKNKMSHAGDMEMPHTWAYLPDAAKAAEAVLNIRVSDDSLPNHMVLPFSGHVFSFTQLHQLLERFSAKPVKISSIPWGLFKVLAVFMPVLRDLLSMRYLWQQDIRLDGTALQSLIGDALVHTPLEKAVKACVPALAKTPAADQP